MLAVLQGLLARLNARITEAWMARIDALDARITSARMARLDGLESRVTSARMGYLDELETRLTDTLAAKIDTLESRLASARVGKLDNLPDAAFRVFRSETLAGAAAPALSHGYAASGGLVTGGAAARTASMDLCPVRAGPHLDQIGGNIGGLGEDVEEPGDNMPAQSINRPTKRSNFARRLVDAPL